MSGIAGLVNLDGTPIDRGVFDRMTAYLAFRGSDIRCVQPVPFVGLAHAGLQLDDDAGDDSQPRTIDRREWIVADARVDARQDLHAALGSRGPVAPDDSDAGLILRAYRAWGDACVSRLLGDFSFAIWDAAARRLFCARDQLGVKPLYYAELGRTVVFSNSLDCVRLHPLVSRELHEPAIADFLLFGANQEADTTSFRDIRRLPAAHSITWSGDAVGRRQYWTLPIDEPLAYRRAGDYTDHFTELLRAAVSDRLRTRRVGVLMSGGLDSPTLAAVAVQLLRQQSTNYTVQAITSVYDRLIPDRERHYAALVAEHLQIPIRYDARDDETSIADWDRVSVRTPEPVDNPPAFVAGVEFLKTMTAHARVFFYGEGPDNALRYEWRPYLSHLLARRRPDLLIRAIARDLLMHPRVPFWSSICQVAGATRQRARWRQVFPGWLDEDFVTRCGCRERWDALQPSATPPHPIRPQGYEGFNTVRWQPLFEECDIQGAIGRCELRHPFLDLRLLRYMLALPAMPWCRNKLIIRRAMRSVLPRAVVRRKKTPVARSPDLARVATCGFPRLTPAPGLTRYVNPARVPTSPTNDVALRAALRPLGFNYWLQHVACP